MTDPTNHADVIKDVLGMLDPSHRRDYMEALTALDALTREAAPSQCKNCDHLWDELRDEEKLKFRAESERDEARATIASQSARIATLEAFIADLDCECIPPERFVDGEMTEKWICLRCAALAPKEALG